MPDTNYIWISEVFIFHIFSIFYGMIKDDVLWALSQQPNVSLCQKQPDISNCHIHTFLAGFINKMTTAV